VVKFVKLQASVKQARKKQAEETDRVLLEFLSRKPGALSLYQLAQEIGWSIGRVQKSVERLTEKRLVTYRRAFLGGRSLKLIVPARMRSDLEHSTVLKKLSNVEVATPADIVDGEWWGEDAFLYALDRTSLGISSREERKWHESSLFESEVSLRKEEDAFVVKMPEKVSRFYRLYTSDYEVSASPKGNKVIISIGAFRTSQ
jgi:hypothetical protein